RLCGVAKPRVEVGPPASTTWRARQPRRIVGRVLTQRLREAGPDGRHDDRAKVVLVLVAILDARADPRRHRNGRADARREGVGVHSDNVRSRQAASQCGRRQGDGGGDHSPKQSSFVSCHRVLLPSPLTRGNPSPFSDPSQAGGPVGAGAPSLPEAERGTGEEFANARLRILTAVSASARSDFSGTTYIAGRVGNRESTGREAKDGCGFRSRAA